MSASKIAMSKAGSVFSVLKRNKDLFPVIRKFVHVSFPRHSGFSSGFSRNSCD